MEDNKKDTVQNAPEDRERRKAIKKIAVGVGVLAGYSVLPEKWVQPIVAHIALPAHAATSGVSLRDPCTVTLLSGTQSSSSVEIRVDGFVVPPTAGLPTTIVAQGSVTVTTITAADGTFTGNLTITGGPGITSVSAVTTVTGADGSASCSVDVPAAATTTSAPATTTTSGPLTTPQFTTPPPPPTTPSPTTPSPMTTLP